jgi:hypothetical protein
MSYEIKTIDNPAEFSEAVGEIVSGKRNELILGKWSGGILEFAGIVFPGVDPNDIFATHIIREPQGREPHFDAYKSYIDEEKFWLGHYNLSGNAEVVTTELARDLQEAYERRYPTQTDESGDARRLFSRIALTEPGARVGHGVMEAGTKMVLPVRPEGPHVVHDIVPTDESKPGEFVKLVVPTRSKDERKELVRSGYRSLDNFITDSIGYAVPDSAEPAKKPKAVKPDTKLDKPPLSSAERLRPRPSQRVAHVRNLHRRLD